MGGFTFPLSNLTSNLSAPIFKSDCKRLTVTARGMALLAYCNLLPNIEKGFLDDKSKSDGLSKLIACGQAAWLVVQVLGRLILGLQVTLLEINTLGHCLCALIMYILWWHKPRMVLEPIVLEGEWVGSMCAYMYMSSLMSSEAQEVDGIYTGPTQKPEISSLAFFPNKPCNHSVIAVKECRNLESPQTSNEALPVTEKISTSTHPNNLHDKRSSASVFATTITGSFGPRPKWSEPPKSLDEDLERSEESEDMYGNSAGRQLRWCLAAEAVRKYPAIQRRFTPCEHETADGHVTKYLQESQPEELVEEHSSNWSTKGLLPGRYGLVMGVALWFSSMAFAGIHAAAWNDCFPSSAEAWLWRCSALYIIWSGLVWMLINLVAQLSKPFDDYWNNHRLPGPPFVKPMPLVVLGFICGILYAFARMYLVIEAFISIRKLPTSAYQTPDWTQVIPHL